MREKLQELEESCEKMKGTVSEITVKKKDLTCSNHEPKESCSKIRGSNH